MEFVLQKCNFLGAQIFIQVASFSIIANVGTTFNPPGRGGRGSVNLSTNLSHNVFIVHREEQKMISYIQASLINFLCTWEIDLRRCFICYALYAMLYLLCFIFFDLAASIFLL